MTEENKIQAEDNEAKESAGTDAVKKEEKKQTKPKKAKKETEEKREAPEIKGLEELPDDIKKKLEKNKAAKSKEKSKKKKRAKTLTKIKLGKAFIKATYNNTIVTITDMSGNVISWASAGVAGFKGAKKSTPYAAQIITRIAVGKAREMGLEEVIVFVSGVGTGRESAVRALNANGLLVSTIKDITPIPHNGCRPKKPRRV